jgi:5-deoxy-glucuronate isomerase
MSAPSWFHRRGALAQDGWESVVDDSLPGWAHTGLRVAALTAGDELTLAAGALERLFVPLAGSFRVAYTDAAGSSGNATLAGRLSVFAGPTDVLYLGADSHATLSGTGRIAVAEVPTREVHPTRHISAAETPVELRGAGASSRQVHNFGTPQTLEASRMIVCEVITPASNWSSYPPHKHDVERPGAESALEEIYYFESAPAAGSAADGAAAFGMFSAYSSPAGEIDIDVSVRSGDIALVPYGYHGPAAAAPGYDLYYLNVMAGPGEERIWLIQDDPRHAWVRASWATDPIDPRLPYATNSEE